MVVQGGEEQEREAMKELEERMTTAVKLGKKSVESRRCGGEGGVLAG